MSENSNISLAFDLYEEGNDETTCDFSHQDLETLPKIDNKFLCVLYLQDNKIQRLPDDFFETLPCITWLDVRDNQLNELPKSIKNHQSLSHLLLQNNNLSSLPNELGTVLSLKVLQVSGNPLTYPPIDVIKAGIKETLEFLHNNFIKEMLQSCSESDDNSDRSSIVLSENDLRSYNSFLDEKLVNPKTFSIQLSEKDVNETEDCFYGNKVKGKCPKLILSRRNIMLPHGQSSKYLKPIHACHKDKQDEIIKRSYMKNMELQKQRDLIASREKILQNKKNLEVLKNFRRNYSSKQLSNRISTYERSPIDYPYDTSPEYMTLLTRQDIEKDLPGKYKKRLWRRPKPTVPRRNIDDVHLAMRIKQLFESLEDIKLNRGDMTPKTEQKMLLTEIRKISEIKEKLSELSTFNSKVVAPE